MLWKNIDAALRSELTKKRSEIGKHRQPGCAADYDRLMSVLEARNQDPFSRASQDIFLALNDTCECFRNGAHWETAKPVDKNKCFYRLETFESFMNKHAEVLHTGFQDPAAISLSWNGSTDKEAMFSTICREYLANGGRWRPLTQLVTSYKTYRNLSWWSNDYDFDPQNLPKFFDGAGLTGDNSWLLDFAFKFGIATDWLSQNMLFMRLDVTDMNLEDIRVPSIIDALLQPIFSPREPELAVAHGLAYNLRNTFLPTHKEFVLRNVQVAKIQYFPVALDENTFDMINPDARITNRMIELLIQNI